MAHTRSYCTLGPKAGIIHILGTLGILRILTRTPKVRQAMAFWAFGQSSYVLLEVDGIVYTVVEHIQLLIPYHI